MDGPIDLPRDGQQAAPAPTWSFADLDRPVHAAEGRFTQGLSVLALALAFLDWGLHLANAPYRRVDLAHLAWEQARRLFSAALGIGPSPCTEPSPNDHRFAADAWRAQPFALFQQAFLLQEEWWQAAMTGLPGVTRSHQ